MFAPCLPGEHDLVELESGAHQCLDCGAIEDGPRHTCPCTSDDECPHW